ncbi:unnamed protein product [Caenorhabditis angaria]|uniref:BZIP domain-containing protein n=1 Tax=Caenorhabditis angaria TaxID=860376 RepID=A0A9P1J3J4_9PELO|nr:unnamed protein product [Caenorhabditis angaria]
MACHMNFEYMNLNEISLSNTCQETRPSNTFIQDAFDVADHYGEYFQNYPKKFENQINQSDESKRNEVYQADYSLGFSHYSDNAQEYFSHFCEDDDMKTNASSDDDGFSTETYVKNRKSVSKFIPQTKPRKYRLKSESEKKDSTYKEKRERNNDAVRKYMKARISELEALLRSERQARQRDAQTIKRLLREKEPFNYLIMGSYANLNNLQSSNEFQELMPSFTPEIPEHYFFDPVDNSFSYGYNYSVSVPSVDNSMDSNQDWDVASSSGSEMSNNTLPEPAKNRKSVSKFIPKTKARPYRLKSQSEKNETYLEKRDKNNDAVRRCRLNAKKEQKKKDQEFEEMKKEISKLKDRLEAEKQAHERDRQTIKRLLQEKDQYN